jgi:rod shape-determining protein MreB
MRQGIYVTGGGALLRGLPELLALELKVPIHVVSDPLTTVVRGTGIVLESPDAFRSVLIDDDDGSIGNF